MCFIGADDSCADRFCALQVHQALLQQCGRVQYNTATAESTDAGGVCGGSGVCGCFQRCLHGARTVGCCRLLAPSCLACCCRGGVLRCFGFLHCFGGTRYGAAVAAVAETAWWQRGLKLYVAVYPTKAFVAYSYSTHIWYISTHQRVKTIMRSGALRSMGQTGPVGQPGDVFHTTGFHDCHMFH